MSSVAMTLKDQGRGGQLDAICPVINRTSEERKFKEQFACGNDYSPKVRKPYTVTKQRERWTDEEHKKFLEALKLYGRAWRRIEEHVGTKTAVQIRSHAQKFFSKVVRESNGLNESSLKLNDIPPPRPKRKPVYPYPRKLVIPAKTGTPLSDERPRITSPDLSVSEKENQSPTSVLSEIGSDTIIDSNTPNGSPSPVSSGAGLNTSGCVQSKPIMSLEENGSPSPVQVDANANLEEQVKLKLELFPRVDALITGEGTADASPTQCLKLFGKTLLITQGCKPLSTSRTCHTQDMETNEGMERQTQTWDSMQMKISLENAECEWSALSCGAPAAIYYMPLCENQSSSVFPRWTSNGDASENQSSPVFPRWTSNGDASFPSGQLYSPVPMKVSPSNVGKGAQENEIQDEGSLTASTTGSVIVKEEGDVDRNGDIETECSRSGLEKDKKQSAFLFKASDKICLGEKRAKTGKALKGFVPYKRCLAERDTSEVTSSERENQRIRLCL